MHLHMLICAKANIIIGDVGDNKGLDSLLVQDTGRLEYAICGEQMSALDYALNLARAGEVTVTKSAWKYVDSDAYRRSEPRRNCVILKSIPSSRREDLPLMRRIRNDRVFKANMQSNPHYFNLGDVKPWTPDGLALCQNAFLVVHKVTSAYAGFIQQFAVDDKGATILCAFGLPYPHSHEKEAIFAAKSAWLIRQRLLDEDVRGFKISLATGVIFTSTIGNEFRRDPAIVGDTIVIAVRILKFEYATNSIVCDDATMVACTSDHDDLCDFEDMGEEYVKGKLYPLRIWRLVHFGAKNQAHQSDDTLEDDIVGYESEREKVTKCLEGWAQAPDRNTLLVMGPRGSGKSMFHQQIFHAADKNGFRICSAPSAEVEQNTEYYPIKFLLLDLFDIMHKHDIPYSAKTDPANAPPRANTDIHDINKTDLEMVPPIAFANSKDSSGCTSMHTTDTIMSTGAAKSQLTSVQDSGSTMHSDGLLQLPAASNRPWHSSFGSSEDVPFSPEINQYDRPSGPNSTSRTKLEALINICLDKLGSNKRNLTTPVLYDIIAGISSDDPTPVIDPEEDHILSEFIVRTLNYACRYVKTIVMFRDIQWCDYKSLNIIQAIHERCPSVLIVLFSRPLRDYGDSNTLKAISNHPSHLEITLEGLRRREIEQALLRAFQDKGVTRISPEIMDLVQERTKGNPKFVKSMSFLLQEFCHFSVVDGELLTTGKETATGPSSKSVEEMLQKQDRKKVTLMQYDRLRPKFQEFLKVASCLGETFTLAEIAAIKPLESLLGAPDQKKSYSTAIIDLDTYRFLSLATNQQTNIQFSRNAVLQTIYTFTSPSTAGDIYESIPYEERVGYHLKLAQFYESFLEQAGHNEDPTKQPLNCQDLLPKITYHYMKTDHTEKKIKYLKALAAFHLKGNMLTDATDNLNELIRIMDTERGAREMVSEEDLADIYGMKGESLSKRMRIEEAEPALLDSLAKYGIFWPSSRSQWRRVLMIEGLKFKYCYNLGLSPVVQKPGKRVPKPRVDHKGQRRLTRIIRVLSCLQNVYFWRTEPDGATLSCFYTLKCSRKLGIPSGDQTTSLARIAIINYYQGNKHDCEKYMDDARRSNETDGATFGMFSAMDAYTEYSEGHLEKAHRLLDEAISESKTFGVVTHLATFYRAVTSKIAYRMWEGSYNVHPKDCQLLRTLSAVAIQNGDSEGEILFAIPTLANLLIHDRLRDAESWVGLIERYIMPKARLMNLLIVHGILSFYYAKTGNYEKSRIYIELLGQNIQKQGVGAHPFPLMSCMFALMAMYEMHDHVRTFPKNDTLEISRSCPFHADANLSYFIAYLKTEPMKLVAEPYICLADTMRSLIVPGHEREASQKLVQGYRELSPALEGLDFVMAYFLTQVGRYSEPELKGPCYQRAHDLFRSMSMNPLIWLTDPTSGWLPPTVADENRADFIMGSIPLPANTEALKEGSLGWAAAKAASSSVADLSTSPLVVTAISTPLQIPRYQDEGASASMDLVMSQEVQLDESSFHRELARASISSAPILHDMEAGLDRSSIETM
ncbi:hypothetical protein BGZ54_001207 [Gamsiella multidivaricata]|nr:hypothetical protein BGZ54_001207 [Gamsiella multidivaricata]